MGGCLIMTTDKTYGYFTDKNVNCTDVWCDKLNIDFKDEKGNKITRYRVKLNLKI